MRMALRLVLHYLAHAPLEETAYAVQQARRDLYLVTVMLLSKMMYM